MSAYFFLWNPEKDYESFPNLNKLIAKCRLGKPYERDWICSSKQPKAGDLAYLQRTGPHDNGVFAKGIVARGSFERDGTRLVTLYLQEILPVGKEIPRSEIIEKAQFKRHWGPYASGNSIPFEILTAIDQLWSSRAAAPG